MKTNETQLASASKSSLSIGFILLAVLLALGITRNAAQSPAENVETKFALLVGISTYQKPNNSSEGARQLTDLESCVNNVAALSKTLSKPHYGFTVKSLLNDKAKHENVKAEFRNHLIGNAEKAHKAGKKAVVVFYFCGHGSQLKDTDEDEDDDYDETFVAYDSGNTGVDILDDEIDELKYDLREFTNNTTLIFESCHSGTGSRTITNDGFRPMAPVDMSEVKHPFVWDSEKKSRKRTTDETLDTYVEISAAESHQIALAETLQTCRKSKEECPEPLDKPMGLFTRALVQVLELPGDILTPKQLKHRIESLIVGRGVNKQTPYTEGNDNARLFRGEIAPPRYIPVLVEPTDKGPMKIDAGAVHGLRPGSLVAVYSQNATELKGKEHYLATGTVVSVSGVMSDVVFEPHQVDFAQINRNSKIVLLSPAFGRKQVNVNLDEADRIGLRGSETVPLKATVEKILSSEDPLGEQGLINVLPSGSRESSITLKRAKMRDIFDYSCSGGNGLPQWSVQKTSLFPIYCDGGRLMRYRDEQRFRGPDAEVLYFDLSIAGEGPLFGKTFNPTDKDLAEDLAASIRNYARYINLRGLENTMSEIPKQFNVKLEELNISSGDEYCDGCTLKQKSDLRKVGGKELLENGTRNYDVEPNAYVRLTLKNRSGEFLRETDKLVTQGPPYYVNVLALLDTGEVRHVLGALDRTTPLPDGSERSLVFKTMDFPGKVRFAAILTKAPADFSFMEIRGSARAPRSFLESILTRPGARGGTSEVPAPNEWGVMWFEINRKRAQECSQWTAPSDPVMPAVPKNPTP